MIESTIEICADTEDMNDLLIMHHASTYLARAKGHSMQGYGIFDGDLLIVDRALEVQDRMIVIVVIDGMLTCKSIDMKNNLFLPANDEFEPIKVNEFSEIEFEGVVIHSIHSHELALI